MSNPLCLIDGKFVRYLFNSSDATDAVLGNSICSYVRLLDKALKLYFLSPSDFNSNLPVLTSDYFELLSNMMLTFLIVILLFITLSLTIIVSTQNEKIRLLIQELSILKGKNNE